MPSRARAGPAATTSATNGPTATIADGRQARPIGTTSAVPGLRRHGVSVDGANTHFDFTVVAFVYPVRSPSVHPDRPRVPGISPHLGHRKRQRPADHPD